MVTTMVEEVAVIFLVTNVVITVFLSTMFDVTLASLSPPQQPASSVATKSLASPCVLFGGLRGHTGFTKESAALHARLREGALRNTCNRRRNDNLGWLQATLPEALFMLLLLPRPLCATVVMHIVAFPENAIVVTAKRSKK